MKTKVFALALALASAFGATVMAQDAADKMYRPQSFTDYAFEGILLTVDQQQKIDALNAELASQRREACEQAKECKKEACQNDNCVKSDCKKDCKKKDCKKPDCKRDKKDCKKGRKFDGRRCAKEARTEYVNKVKEVLTPEQYTTFLENIVNMPAQPGMGRHGNKACVEGKVPKDCKEVKNDCKKVDAVKAEVKKLEKAGK